MHVDGYGFGLLRPIGSISRHGLDVEAIEVLWGERSLPVCHNETATAVTGDAAAARHASVDLLESEGLDNGLVPRSVNGIRTQ